MRDYGNTDQVWDYFEYLEQRIAEIEKFLSKHALPPEVVRGGMVPLTFEQWKRTKPQETCAE